VKCEMHGEIQVNSDLPGLPDLMLSFANPTILNDVRFHPCAQFRPWESDRILSFVPPEGQFTPMSYRFVFVQPLSQFILLLPCLLSTFSFFYLSIIYLITQGKKLNNAPIYIKPQLTSDAGTCRINVLVGIRNDPGKPIDNITVRFHLPSRVASAELTSNYGTVNVLADKVCILFLNGAMPLDGSCWNSIIFCFFGFVNISM